MARAFACVFVGYGRICDGEKLSVVSQGYYWVQLRLRASLAVLMADFAGGGGYAMGGRAGVVRETWQRLLGSLVSAAKRPCSSSSVLAVVCRVGCRLLISMAGRQLVVSHLRGGSEYGRWQTRDCCMSMYTYGILSLFFSSDTRKGQTTITHPKQHRLLISCAYYGELLSTRVHIPREHV